MERYRLASKINAPLSQNHNFQPNYHSLSPKSHLREPPADRLGRRADDTEISIFDAERYFNDNDSHSNTKRMTTIILEELVPERCDLSGSYPRDSSVSSLDGYGRNYRISSTPTASSEASWNSQSGLLTHTPGSVAVSVRGFPLHEHRRSRRFFLRNCPCSGKKSLNITEPKTPIHSIHDHKAEDVSSNSPETTSFNLSKQISGSVEPDLGVEEVRKMKIVPGPGGFSFPILNTSTLDDPPRESLEVFRPTEELLSLRKSIELNYQTSSVHFLGDINRRSLTSRPSEEDAASDTSSDLFEIESFSTFSRRKDPLEEAAEILNFRRSLEGAATPSIAPSECYPPSEVSVEWSVTTAEGFERGSVANFSSAASDYEEFRFMQEEHDRFAARFGGRGRPKGGGLLSSCVCEKAVSVGPSPMRIGRSGAEPDRVYGVARMQDRVGMVRSQSARVGRPVQSRLVVP